MVKKVKASAGKKKHGGASGLFDSALAGSVKESAQQIWLAGMGAFAKAQAEGKQVFDALVQEGTTLQKKTQSVAEEKLGEVSSRMTSMAGEVGAKAGKQWDKLESIIEDRTAQAMKKLGVPTSADVQALRARVDALSEQLAAQKRAAAVKRSSAGTKPAKKAGAKRAVKKATGAAKRPARKAAAASS